RVSSAPPSTQGTEPTAPLKERQHGSARILWLPSCNALGTASYLYADAATGAAAIVDAAGLAPLLLREASKRGWRVEQVLLTHGHLDHIQAVPDFARAAAAAGQENFTVQIHGADRQMYEEHYGLPLPLWLCRIPLAPRGIAALLAYFFGMTREAMPAAWVLEEGNPIFVGSLQLEVLHIPGHSPGHVAFYDASNGVAFTGDTLMRGVIGSTSFPQCDERAMGRSLRRLLDRIPDETAVFSGHTAPTTMGQERKSNLYLTSQVLAAFESGNADLFRG
ncbi:unnamed protein product, partial [Polarella glacialis]